MNGSSLGGAGMATSKQPGGASPSNASTMSSGRAISATSLGALEGERGQRALPHDHGMDELDRDVPRVRPRRRRLPDREQPASGEEPVRHLRAETRDVFRLRGEERAIGLGAGGEEIRRRRHAGAPALVVSATSQSRTASIPSPVRALTSIRGTPGWTPSRW